MKPAKISQFVIITFLVNPLQKSISQTFEGATVNTSIMPQAASQQEFAGANSSTNSFSPTNKQYEPSIVTISAEQLTRHHRLGQSTGIGDSFIQTSSPTVESRPLSYVYKDYNISPAQSNSSSFTNSTNTETFSPFISPALSTPAFSSTNKRRSTNSGADLIQSITRPGTFTNLSVDDIYIKSNKNRLDKLDF